MYSLCNRRAICVCVCVFLIHFSIYLKTLNKSLSRDVNGNLITSEQNWVNVSKTIFREIQHSLARPKSEKNQT